MKSDKFWMVWSPQGNQPTYKHESEQSAKQEAERLAKIFQDRQFVVLESIAEVRVTNVFWKDHENPNEVPF